MKRLTDLKIMPIWVDKWLGDPPVLPRWNSDLVFYFLLCTYIIKVIYRFFVGSNELMTLILNATCLMKVYNGSIRRGFTEPFTIRVKYIQIHTLKLQEKYEKTVRKGTLIGEAVQQLAGITILYPDFFAVFMVSVALVTLATFVFPKYAKSINEVRRIPALEGLDEMTRACAEKGRPLNWGCTLEYNNQYLPAGLVVLRTISKLCGDLSVPMVLQASDAQSYLMIFDAARQGFGESLHPEIWNPNLAYFAPGDSATRTNISNIEEHNVAGNVIWGVYGGGHNPSVLLVARRAGAISMAAIKYPDSMAITLPWCEYNALGEEMVVAGAYISRDPKNTASIVGSDLVKLVIIACMIGFSIKTLAGL